MGAEVTEIILLFGERGGTRTLDPMIKSHVLIARRAGIGGETDVRGAFLESAAEGKTIAAKRGSRSALELWPTIEQGTNWPPNLVPVLQFSRWTNPSFARGEGSTFSRQRCADS
jgi:hypothetical protein